MGLVHGFPSYIVVILNIKYFYIYGNTYLFIYLYKYKFMWKQKKTLNTYMAVLRKVH